MNVFISLLYSFLFSSKIKNKKFQYYTSPHSSAYLTMDKVFFSKSVLLLALKYGLFTPGLVWINEDVPC